MRSQAPAQALTDTPHEVTSRMQHSHSAPYLYGRVSILYILL